MIRGATQKPGYAEALRTMPLVLVALLLSRSELQIWYAALLAAGMVWWGLVSERRAKLEMHRLTHDLCPGCGYDLRASPTYCPECGTPRIPPEPV